MSTVRLATEPCLASHSCRPDRAPKTWRVSSVSYVSLLLCLALGPTPVVLAQTPEKSVSSPQVETMVVNASLNTVDKGDLFVQRTAGGDFLVKTEDLRAMGFNNPSGPPIVVDGAPHLSLRAMQGVGFIFDDRLLTLAVTAEPQLLTGASFNLQGGSRTRGVVAEANSAFFNYALDYAGNAAGDGKANATTEIGWRFADYLFTTNATTQRTDGTRQLTRLMTSITRDDRDNLLRFVGGDFFTVPQALGSPVNMAGLSVSKRYALDPYFIRNPLQNIRGMATTPSQLELYVDGQRIRTEKIQPGGFELRDILAYGGASSAQLVLRDAFGRVQQFDYSFYYSDQPLAQGLNDYSYSLGALRQDYGLASNHYGATAFSAFHRYGLTDAITVGGFAEGTRGLLNAGPSATVVLGSAGVLNFTMAASKFDGVSGKAALANYSFQSRRWSFGATLRREAGSYAMLASPVTLSNRKYDASLSAGYNVPGAGSVYLSYAATSSNPAPLPGPFVNTTTSLASRVTALSYNLPLFSGRSSLITRLSHVRQDEQSRNEAFIGLNYNFDGNYFAAANLRKDQRGTGESFQFTKNQPVGEGLGYTASVDRSNGSLNNAQSSLQYNAPAAIFRGSSINTYSQGQSTRAYSLSVAGGVGYAGGLTAYGRPITDSFGIVKVGEVAGVDVSVNGQLVGKTDSRGILFLPTLSAYYDSDVSISSASVPIEYSVPIVKLKLSPSLRSGSVLNFEITRLQALTGSIQTEEQGQRRPLEFIEATLMVGGKPVLLQTGRRGEFYLDNIKPGTYAATASVDGKLCQIELTAPVSSETFVELGEVVCRNSP